MAESSARPATNLDSPRALAGVFSSGVARSLSTSKDRRRRQSLPAVGTATPSNVGCDSDGVLSPREQELSDAMAKLGADETLEALTNPCFFHKRFGDAVNIEKVLEEMQADDHFSHNKLMQTAASVREVSRQLQRRSTKQPIRTIMIVTKARDNTLVEKTSEVAHWLMQTPRYGKDTGVNVYVDSKLRASKRFDAEGLLAKNPHFKSKLRYWTPELCWTSPELFDLVITLGGDGTVLFTSWLFQRIVPPVVAFSLGTLGFLTTFRYEDYQAHLDRLMSDSGMRVTMRMRFTCTVYRASATGQASIHHKSSSSASLASTLPSRSAMPSTVDLARLPTQQPKIEGETYEVLNELVVDRGPSSYISSLDLYASDALLTRINADGMILSTPTGSTAYSLSAGGSLVYPDIPAMLLTPICPHTLSFRPMILNDGMELKIRVPSSGRGTAFVSFDGKGKVELGRGDEIVVRASRFPFPTVLSQPTEWFDAISRTLRWNTRAVDQGGWAKGRNKSLGGAEGDAAVVEEGGEGEDKGEEEERFDIDFDDEESTRDSGYGGGSSVA